MCSIYILSLFKYVEHLQVPKDSAILTVFFHIFLYISTLTSFFTFVRLLFLLTSNLIPFISFLCHKWYLILGISLQYHALLSFEVIILANFSINSKQNKHKEEDY